MSENPDLGHLPAPDRLNLPAEALPGEGIDGKFVLRVAEGICVGRRAVTGSRWWATPLPLNIVRSKGRFPALSAHNPATDCRRRHHSHPRICQESTESDGSSDLAVHINGPGPYRMQLRPKAHEPGCIDVLV